MILTDKLIEYWITHFYGNHQCGPSITIYGEIEATQGNYV